MVEFRKRFPPEAIAAILEASIPKKPPKDHDDQGKTGGNGGQEAEQSEPETPPNSGTLVMDATCCPADITFPQDFHLLNHARELAEDIVREICKANGWKTPRMYSRIARKAFLNPFQEQEALRQGHSEVHQAAAAVHPSRYRVYHGLHPKQRNPA